LTDIASAAEATTIQINPNATDADAIVESHPTRAGRHGITAIDR
jgi:hypothetical protein